MRILSQLEAHAQELKIFLQSNISLPSSRILNIKNCFKNYQISPVNADL